MSLGLSAYGSKYVLCQLGVGGGGTCSCCFLMATSGGTQNHWRTFPCWLCETNSSLSGFSGDRKRECGLYTLTGRTLHVETKFVLLQTFGRHDGARHMKISGAHSQQIMQQVGFTEILQLAALVGLSRQFTHKPPVFTHAENWKSCLLSSGFFLLEGALKSLWGAGDLFSRHPVRDKGFMELGRALIRTFGSEHTTDGFNSPVLFPENGWSF